MLRYRSPFCPREEPVTLDDVLLRRLEIGPALDCSNWVARLQSPSRQFRPPRAAFTLATVFQRRPLRVFRPAARAL